MATSQRVEWRMVGVLLLGALLRLWQLGGQTLIGDEASYWLWSRALDWSYYDHPAGVALVIRLSTALLGESELGVRWLNAALGLVAVALVFRLGRSLFSPRAGLLAAVAVAFGAPFLLTSRLVYTDTVLIVSLLANLALFWRLVRPAVTVRTWDCLLFGVSMAVMLNTKYAVLLYALALAVSILLDYRHLLRVRSFWLGVAVSAAGLIPVVGWNAVHGWASFRWQLAHAAAGVLVSTTLVGRLGHAVVYVTWPLAVIATASLGWFRQRRQRLLGFISVFLLAPALISPANSPRNLTAGLVPALILAGSQLARIDFDRRWPPILGWARAAFVLMAAVYGLGTVIGLGRPTRLPGSSVVGALRCEMAGWDSVAAMLQSDPGPIYALDYSLAGQIQYITGRYATTSWGQYRIWGIRPLERATVVSLDYLPAELLTERLAAAFETVEGPRVLLYSEPGIDKAYRIWRVAGPRMTQEALIDWLDWLTIMGANH